MKVMKNHRWPAVIASSAAVLVFLLAAGASRAMASTVYPFTSCHVSGGCGTSPFGSVTLTQNGTSVSVDVSLESGAYFVSTGAGDGYQFKLVGLASSSSTYGGALTSSDFTITSPASPGLAASGPGSFDGDGTGYFAFGISCPSCSNGGAGKFAGPIDFTVANATISDLTVANGLGFVFVADALLPNGNTGPIDASTPTTAPEPGAVTLVGFVLLAFIGLAGYSRHKLLA